MIQKKIFFLLFIFSFLGACTSPTAMLGPAYTFSSSGSVIQTGMSYGSGELIKSYTGKTPLQNILEISELDINENEINIHKKTLESEDFYYLVKKRIEQTNKILININQ